MNELIRSLNNLSSKAKHFITKGCLSEIKRFNLKEAKRNRVRKT